MKRFLTYLLIVSFFWNNVALATHQILELDFKGSRNAQRLHTILPLSNVRDISHIEIDTKKQQVVVHRINQHNKNQQGHKYSGEEQQGAEFSSASPVTTPIIIQKWDVMNLPWEDLLKAEMFKSFLLQHTAYLTPLEKGGYTLTFKGSLLGGGKDDCKEECIHFEGYCFPMSVLEPFFPYVSQGITKLVKGATFLNRFITAESKQPFLRAVRLEKSKELVKLKEYAGLALPQNKELAKKIFNHLAAELWEMGIRKLVKDQVGKGFDYVVDLNRNGHLAVHYPETALLYPIFTEDRAQDNPYMGNVALKEVYAQPLRTIVNNYVQTFHPSVREQVSRALSPIPFLMAHHGSQLLNRAIDGIPLSKEVFEGNMRHVFEKHMALAGGVNNHQTISQKLAQPLIQADINVLKKQGIKLKGVALGSRVDENINGDISVISQTNDLAYPLFSDDRAKAKSFLPQGLGENRNFVILQPTLRLIHHWSQELKTNRVLPQWAHVGATAEKGEGLRLKGSRYTLERVINLSGHGIVRAILEAQFKTNVPGIFRVQIYDGTTSKVSDFHTGNGASQLLAVDFPVNDTATQLTLRAIRAGDSINNPNTFVDISRISFALLDRVSLLDFPTDNIQVSRIGNMLKLHGGHFNFSAEIPLSSFLGNSVEVRTQMLSHTPNLYGMQLYDGQVSVRSDLRHSGSGEFELISASYNKREGAQKLEIRTVQANDEVFDPLYRSIAPTMGVHINQNLQLMHKLTQNFQTNPSLKEWSQQLYAEEFDKKFIEDTLLPHLRNYTSVTSYKNYQDFMSDKGTGYKVGMNLNSYMDLWKPWNNGAIKVFPKYAPPHPLITRTGEGIQLKGSSYNFERVLDISNRKVTGVTLESIFKTNVPNMFGVQIWDGYTSTDRSKNRHTGDGTFQTIRETHLIDPRATHLYLRAIQANASSDPNVVVDLRSAIYSLTENQDLRQWDKTGLLAENRGGGVAIVGHRTNLEKIFKLDQLFGNEITIKGTLKTNIPEIYGLQLCDRKQANRSDKHSGSGRVEDLSCSLQLHPEATELIVRAIQANTKIDGNIYDPYYRDLGKAIVSMVSHSKVLDEILAKTIEGKADLNYLRRLLLSQGIQVVSDDPVFLTTLGYAARHMVENALLGDFKFGQFLKTMVAEWSKPQILSTPIREAVVKTLETPVEEATPKAMIFPEEQGKAKILITYPEEETGMQILTWEVLDEALKKIPKELGEARANRKGIGVKWSDKHGNNYVRIDKGNPNHELNSQKVDHVRINYNNQALDCNGNPIQATLEKPKPSKTEEAHIPLEVWRNWREWNKP